MAEKKTWHVYLLRCFDGTIYTGCTGNLDQRLSAHNNGEVSYTKTRLPFELVTTPLFTINTKHTTLKNTLRVAPVKLL